MSLSLLEPGRRTLREVRFRTGDGWAIRSAHSLTGAIPTPRPRPGQRARRTHAGRTFARRGAALGPSRPGQGLARRTLHGVAPWQLAARPAPVGRRGRSPAA